MRWVHAQVERRVELKERKILKILKNHFGQFHKLNNDNSQLHTTSCGLSNLNNFIFNIGLLCSGLSELPIPFF